MPELRRGASKVRRSGSYRAIMVARAAELADVASPPVPHTSRRAARGRPRPSSRAGRPVPWLISQETARQRVRMDSSCRQFS